MLGLILVYFGGWQTQFLFAYTGGTTLAVLAIAMLAVYFGAGARAAFTVAGAALVWYWLLPLPFSLFSEAGEGVPSTPSTGCSGSWASTPIPARATSRCSSSAASASPPPPPSS